MTITLYRFGAYYLRVPENPQDNALAYSTDSIRTKLPLGKPFAGRILADCLGQAECEGEQFVALEDASLVILGSTAEYGGAFLGHRLNEDKLRYAGLFRLHQWQLFQQSRIVSILVQPERSLNDALKVVARYTHSDGYSLWIFNPHTDVFTCAASSHRYDKTFFLRTDASTLFQFLDSGATTESRPPSVLLCLNAELTNCNTLNRIRIDLDHGGTIAILNLYSLHERFIIPDNLISTVRDVVRSQYGHSRIELHKRFETLEQLFTTNYKLGELPAFLCLLTERICSNLHFECCSIFTTDPSRPALRLVATTDAKIRAGKQPGIVYPIDETSLTGIVAKSGKLRVSYDLTTDSMNSRRYSESSILPGTNWAGVPVLHSGSVMGVIRVKNKYSLRAGAMELANIRPAEIEYLQSIAMMLDNLMQIEYLYVQACQDLSRAQEQLESQNDFNAVFLHEIKTPISTFALAPLTIQRRMEFVRNALLTPSKDAINAPATRAAISENLEKINLRLADISVMADRLKFVADTYFFDLIIAKHAPQRLSVLQDVVFPVVNITKEYFRRNYELEIKVDAASLQGLHVEADQTMVTLVLNALVDNAGKYTVDSPRPIIISGNTGAHDVITIVVVNYGLDIDEDEVEAIFEKGRRGRKPRERNISGTGIGLHLGREIMRKQNGDLRLLQRANPVRFGILLPRIL